MFRTYQLVHQSNDIIFYHPKLRTILPIINIDALN